jgi:hypothetical protein
MTTHHARNAKLETQRLIQLGIILPPAPKDHAPRPTGKVGRPKVYASEAEKKAAYRNRASKKSLTPKNVRQGAL